MKLNLKKVGVEAEADVERIIEKSIDSHEKDWKEKFETKHNAKKEILELKHKHKMEEQNYKSNMVNTKLNKEKSKDDDKKIFKIVGIILFFVYGFFCIAGFKDSHLISAIISLVQVLLILVSILSSINLVSLFKNDYKICLVFSILLIIPWLAFAI